MSATTPTSAQEKPIIVCIDDEPEMLRLIRLTLGRLNFELVTAESGREGLELVRRLKPHLVLLDLMLPDLDGWTIYQQMKIDEELQHIPVIVVTAKDQSIDRLLGLHIAKVDGYITKPFGPQELINSIKKALGIES